MLHEEVVSSHFGMAHLHLLFLDPFPRGKLGFQFLYGLFLTILEVHNVKVALTVLRNGFI